MRLALASVAVVAAAGCGPAARVPPAAPPPAEAAPAADCPEPDEPDSSQRDAAFERGYELVGLGAHQRAIEPLRRCLEADPAFAKCHHFLAEALQATQRMQAALEHYDAAIRADPTVPYFYPPYVEALVVVKQWDAAARVASEGMRVLPTTEDARPHLYALHVLSFQVFQARDDRDGMVQALEKAHAVAGDDHPLILFNLGSTYAISTPPDPRARELLDKFFRRVCRGAAAAKYAEQCHTTQLLLHRLRR